MKTEDDYWLITYTWLPLGPKLAEGITGTRPTKRILSYALHAGFIGNWILESLKQPEDWIMINSVKLSSQNEYSVLREKIGDFG